MAEDRMLSDEILLGLIKKNSGGGGGGGTGDYNDLINQPQIGGNILVGNKSASDLGLASEEDLVGKQDALTAGDYIDITSGEISVNREIPASNYSYEIVTKSTGGNDASVTIKKYANGTLVSSTDYIYNKTGTVNVDGYFTFQWVSGWRYTLLQASTTHAEGYTASWTYLDVVDITEVFPTEDTSGLKLIIKSELDSALATKQDAINYSTTEQKTGQKWIDGKDIYKKTMVIDNPVSGGTTTGVAHNITDYGELINIIGVAKLSQASISLNTYGGGADYYTAAYVDSTNLIYDIKWGTASFLQLKATIYYTKTT